MWMGPVLYVVVSLVLWKYVGAVFMPVLMARTVFAWMPALADVEMVVVINMALIYFAAYFLIGIFWWPLKPYLRHPFLVAFELWLINVVIVFPILGRGVLGYQLPQGWISASLPLLVSHWIFARGLQFQQRR